MATSERPTSGYASFATPGALALVVAPLLAGISASVGGWPKWLVVSAMIVGLMLAAIALFREPLGRRLGGRCERFLADAHSPARQRGCMAMGWLVLGGGLLAVPVGGGQWAWAVACVGAGIVALYWGSKVCPSANAKRAAAGIAMGGWMLSLSANFVAGAIAGETSLESTVGVISGKVDRLVEGQRRVEEGQQVIREGQQQAAEQLARIERFLQDQKQPGIDPTTRLVPPDVLAAAEELIKSKDSRERAAAAIVLKQWDVWEKEITRLNANAASEEVFQNKMLEGHGLFEQGKFDEAIAPYEVAFGLRQDSLQARLNLALTLTESTSATDDANRSRALRLVTTGPADMPVDARITFLVIESIAWRKRQDVASGTKMERSLAALNAARALAAEHYPGSTVRHIEFERAVLSFMLGSWKMDAELLRDAYEGFRACLAEIDAECCPTSWADGHAALAASGAMLLIARQTVDMETVGVSLDACDQVEAMAGSSRPPTPRQLALVNIARGILAMIAGQGLGGMQQAEPHLIAATERASKESDPILWAYSRSLLARIQLIVNALAPDRDNSGPLAMCNEALTVFTRDESPEAWALVHESLSMAYSDPKRVPGLSACECYARAAASTRAALSVQQAATATPLPATPLQRRLSLIRDRYQSLGCDNGPGGVAFDDIPPAE